MFRPALPYPYSVTQGLPYSKIQEGWIRSSAEAYAAVSAFLGVVDFFGVAFFAGAFFGAAGFFVVGGAVALVLVTRPDLVLVSTFGTSTTAGACTSSVYGLADAE